MIVGNGEIAKGLAGEIDAADLVLRFNTCRSLGAGGQKTDMIAVCNTGRPARAMLHEGDWKTSKAVAAAPTIWCVRDPETFAALRAPLSKSHPELDDFCDDYTDGFAAFARDSGKAFHVVPAATHEAVDRDLKASSAVDYVVPSSGIIAIAEMMTNHMEAGDEIVIAGFTHQGWEWHPWDAERAWIDNHVAARRLNRL